MAILHPQECYLLERFISLDYYRRRWQAWRDFVEHCEQQMALYCQNLPPQQRSLPLWQQYDVVWNSRILPNIRGTLSILQRDYVQRQHNDPRAYFTGGNVASDCKGIGEYWPQGWMSKAALARYSDLLSLGVLYDHVMQITADSIWNEGSLTYQYSEQAFGPLDLPPQIPRYALDPSVVLGPNDPVTVTGLYLPDVEYAGAQFFHPRSFIPHVAPQGRKRSDFIDEDTGERDYTWEITEDVPATWTLIRRVENEFISVPPQGFFPNERPDELYHWPEREPALLTSEQKHLTLPSGEVCPHDGIWSTFQIKGIERRHFSQGDILPQWQTGKEDFRPIHWTLLERDDGGAIQFPGEQ
ncbi:hypothetical protein VSX61_19160 [Brenneria populi subsp. brevivirga]|uniref:hypothetical protein n=1 Tax=Brenneria populi TaxID=1505588 RepID=UPI002E190CAF|nr:hypothetical protein [Brenneria populi subsp. brevivirga]